MPYLTDQNIIDIGKTTLANLDPPNFNQIATPLQRYEVMPRVLKKDNVIFESGDGIKRPIMTRDNGAAQHVGLYQTHTVNGMDVMQEVFFPWRHTSTYFIYERREILVNRKPSKIVDLFKVREAGSMISLAGLLEDAWFGNPTDESDQVTPWGLYHYLVFNAAADGHVGGNPAGFANCAGLDTAAYPNWANYSARYTNVTADDLVMQMRRAKKLTDFKSPVDIPDMRKGTGQQYRIYMNEETSTKYETLAMQQNDNLGKDCAPYDGETVFRRTPIVYVPKLDSDPRNPVLMIDFATLFIGILKGDYLHRHDPAPLPFQPNVFWVPIDLTWQTICLDRRANSIIAQVV